MTPEETIRQQVNEAIAACVPCVVVDLETSVIIGSTPTADILFGYIEGELVGKSIHDLLPDRLRDKHRDHFVGYAKTPAPRKMGSQRMQLVGMRADRSEFPLAIGLYPRVVASRRAAIATILDMTVRD